MSKAWKHFKTIMHHKCLVAKGCFNIGLYKQGLFHDLSKFSPTEFMVGAKFFQGNRSPNNAEREEYGYSEAWMHHKGRNKHHYEYWIDYSKDPAKKGQLVPVPMPDKYVAEMVMDRIAASKVYEGKNYTDNSPLVYFNPDADHPAIHPDTAHKLEMILRMLADKGEEETFQYIRRELLHKK